MALTADLCSVMHAYKMLPGKGLGFNHSGSRIFSNLSLGKNGPTYLPCLFSRNEKQHSNNYNHDKVLCMSARRATKLNVAVIPPGAGETREPPLGAGTPHNAKVVSVETLVGPRGGIGEICHIVLDHGGRFRFVEGQWLHVHFQTIKTPFPIASCRHGDDYPFDGKTLSICVRRAELSNENVSNYLCNLNAGDEVEISGPFRGQMVFPQGPRDAKHIMVGIETGIAPFRSNLQRLFVDPYAGVRFNGLVWLISGAQDDESLLYNNEFTQIKNDHINHFRYEKALNDSVNVSIYRKRQEIFTLLNYGGANIYFAVSNTTMDGILETFRMSAAEIGVNWDEMLGKLIENGQWRVEVY